MILISQKAALRQLKEATGLTLDDCAAIVAELDKHRTGKRMKVRSADVTAAIADIRRPARRMNAAGIKPLAKKKVVAGRVVRVKRQRESWPDLIG